MKGSPVPNPHESITLFNLCSAMEWNHLPVAGGIYDQHPDLLEQWLYIFAEKSKHDKRERDKDKPKTPANARRPRSRRR